MNTMMSISSASNRAEFTFAQRLIWAIKPMALLGSVFSFALMWDIYHEQALTFLDLIIVVLCFSLVAALYRWLAVQITKHWYFSSGGRLSIYRDKLLQFYAFLTAMAAIQFGPQLLSPPFSQWFSNTPLETLIGPSIYLSSGFIAVGMALWLWRLPGYLAVEAISARLPIQVVTAVLRYWLFWIFIALTCWVIIFPPFFSIGVKDLIDPKDDNFPQLILIFYVTSLVFTLIMIGLTRIVWKITSNVDQQNINTRQGEEAASLWLIFSKPIENKLFFKRIDRLLKLGLYKTINLVAPPSKVISEHLYYADQAGKLKALFPRRNIEINDWLRAVPVGGLWKATICREIYPTTNLLLQTVQTLRVEGDYTMLVWEKDVDLEHWRGKLPIDKTNVLVGDKTSEVPIEIAGYATVADNSEELRRRLMGHQIVRKPIVFISHNRSEHQAYAQYLSHTLQTNCEVLSDPVMLPGDNWIEKLPAVLERADVVIALVGSATAQSNYQLQEIKYAIALGKLLIPVFIDPFEEPHTIRNYMPANPHGPDDFLYIGLQEEKQLAEVLRSTADNILRRLNIQPVEEKPFKRIFKRQWRK